MSQINSKNLDTNDELVIAIQNEDFREVKKLLSWYQYNDRMFDNAFFWAINQGNFDIIVLFFETGRVNIKRINENEDICILSEAISRNNTEVVYLLLNLGVADLNCTSKVINSKTGKVEFYRPFQYAVVSKNLDIIEALLRTSKFNTEAKEYLKRVNYDIDDPETTHSDYIYNVKVKELLEEYLPQSFISKIKKAFV